MATTIKADLATGDVHQPSAPPNRSARRKAEKVKAKHTRGARKGLRMTIDHPQHGRFEIRHMSDGSTWLRGDGLELDSVLASDVATGPVWIQLAKVGAFRGHAAGPFSLTAQTFGEIVSNFRATSNQRIPIDFEHASEQDSAEGSIPTTGAPAQGWIVDLDNRGEGGLWGRVEWLPLARDYIKSGAYKFFSPAIRFGAKDRVTGAPIGARMTSGALTNNPFLDGLKPLAAKDSSASGSASFSSHETMPRIKSALALHPLTHPKAVRASLADLSDMMARCGGAPGTVDGVDLMAHAGPLRDLANMPASATWAEIIGVIEELIDSAMDQHVEELHPDDEAEEAEMTDAAKPAAETPDNHGAAAGDAPEAPTKEPITMANPNDEVVALSARIAEVEREKASEKTKALRLEAENGTLSASLSDTEARLVAVEAENKRLLADHKKWESAAVEADVDSAIANATDGFKAVFCADRREDLVDWRRSAPAAFAKAAPPPVPANQRHLMTDRILRADKASVDLGKARESHQDAVRRLMRDEKMSYEAAFTAAAKSRKGGLEHGN